MSFFVYILRNPEGRVYIGQTSDLKLRLRQHNEGRAFWTKNRGPWELIHSEPVDTRSAGIKLERKLKSLKSNKAVMHYVAQSVESRQSRDRTKSKYQC